MALQQSMAQSPVRLSTVVLVTVAMCDLVSTLFWLNSGQGEGNAFFAELARHGSFAFSFAKLAFLILPLALIEWARKRRPITAELGTWVAAGAYLYLWGGHVLTLR
ncbi:MAG: hypothetical protein JSS66_01330 [Armatimonadetes bacterium]|nr:hypothetical protein [Armatimonadota bacterium]